MAQRMINIGYGNLAAAQRVVAVIGMDSAPVRRMVQTESDAGRVVDATCGHKTRSVLVMDSGHLLLSPLTPESVGGRLSGDSVADTE